MGEIRKRIVKRDLEPPNKEDAHKLAFVLDGVYTVEECENLIRKIEEKGFDQVTGDVGPDTVICENDRNGYRCLWDDYEITADMFERIRSFFPEEFKGDKIVGVNERLRFLKYYPGNFFKPHFDGCYIRPNGKERSYFTVHLYLNEGYKGGSTTFVHNDNAKQNTCRLDVMAGDVTFPIKIGSVLVFEHDILHEGSVVHEGIKYTVRSDMMYCSP